MQSLNYFKMKKTPLLIAAIALLFVACENNQNEIAEEQSQIDMKGFPRISCTSKDLNVKVFGQALVAHNEVDRLQSGYDSIHFQPQRWTAPKGGPPVYHVEFI